VAGSINERIRHFFQELATDPVEERVVEYVIREVHNGRRLMEVIEDPFVKNRLSSDKVEGILQSAEVVAALEEEIHAAFQTPDVGLPH
jgi:hypothetical protein